jgi:Lar family restriction alleviation protein
MTRPTPALLPCPFCGCLAWIHSMAIFPGGIRGWRIECEGDCHAMTCWWHSEQEAVATWNTRTTQPKEPTQ